jgi:hypothetical protein
MNGLARFSVLKGALVGIAVLATCDVALAVRLPASVAGKWIYRDYDVKAGKDKPDGYTTVFEVFANGTVKVTDGGTGKVVSYKSNEIRVRARNKAYKMIITWNPQTAIGQILFSDAPPDSPKKKEPGPYDISMRRD